MPEPLLLDRAAATAYLGVRSVKSFDRYVRPRLPKPVMVGRVPYWRAADLAAWVERQTPTPREHRPPTVARVRSAGSSALPMSADALAMRKRLMQPSRKF